MQNQTYATRKTADLLARLTPGQVERERDAIARLLRGVARASISQPHDQGIAVPGAAWPEVRRLTAGALELDPQ